MTLDEEVCAALGMAPCDKWKIWGQGLAGPEYIHLSPCEPPCFPAKDPYKYSTSWALTGPLIELYKISLSNFLVGKGKLSWLAAAEDPKGPYEGSWQFDAQGSTPLLAICNLILTLSKEGKLSR